MAVRCLIDVRAGVKWLTRLNAFLNQENYKSISL
jgi:hypothetical protein